MIVPREKIWLYAPAAGSGAAGLLRAHQDRVWRSRSSITSASTMYITPMLVVDAGEPPSRCRAGTSTITRRAPP
jgi:hypothetical protein